VPNGLDPFAHLRVFLRSLPEKPGIYKHIDADDKILYIGKAKSLKNRVNSYFRGKHDNQRLQNMVLQVRRIEFMVTETEYEALLLENTLIKKEQPKYNINLKDGKSYPWIVIKKERFPRVYPTFQFKPREGEYYGPYVSSKGMYTVLDLIKQLYPLRTCNLALSKDNIRQGKFKVCLEYHLKNCKGPCVGDQSEAEYNRTLESVRSLLKGRLRNAKKILHQQMEEQAAALEFEAAQESKERLLLLEKYQAKSTVVNPTVGDADVFTLLSDAEFAYVNGLVLREGAVVRGHTLEFKKKLDESDAELLAVGVAELRELFGSETSEILLSQPLDLEIDGVKVTVPQRGDKVRLIELSLRNARAYRLEKLKNLSIVDPDRHVNRLMKQMQTDLRLPVEPRHFECFDNSNFHGDFPVSACVVFKDGKPSKRDYRHFNVKTVEGPNDFATMAEVITRRYKRLLEEEQPLPQLILVDGGKGQLSAALEALNELGLRGKISIIGIAKRLEELYYPGDSDPLYLDKRSETLKVLQRARDEAHRFGITHHRNRRSKGTIATRLETIAGVGPATVELLLSHFKSAAGIERATLDEVVAVVGSKKAAAVKAALDAPEAENQ
jgi:excinuclease ABC subunit C